MWLHRAVSAVTVELVEWDDDELARQVEEALTGGGCAHPLDAVHIGNRGVSCDRCGGVWGAGSDGQLLTR